MDFSFFSPTINFLLAPVPLAFGLSSSWAEILGFVTGAVCVGLAAKANIWNWPIGLANSGFWLILFMGSGLYADSFLQVVYLIMGVYGWVWWLRGGPKASARPIAHVGRAELAVIVVLVLLSTTTWYYVLSHHTNSTVPLADAITTVLSLAANWMLARKLIENWPLWIFGVNAPYIGLYLYKGLALTASLQFVFIALSVMGWITWQRELTARQAKAKLALELSLKTT